MTRNRTLGLLIAGLIIAIDQFVKYIVTGPLQLKEHGLQGVEIIPFFKLTYAENWGVSMGMLTANSDTQRWLLVVLTGVITAAVAVWMWREKAKWDVVALSMILGGALGNLIDRIRLGFVVDYADLHFGDFRPFFIFNFADMMITFGVVILIVRAFLLRDDKEQASEGQD